MKQIDTYITEKLKLNRDSGIKNQYNYHPKTREELDSIIRKLMSERGLNADLNDIYTGDIKDMSSLFHHYSHIEEIDISEWDTHSCTDMNHMFYNCEYFNCDLSEWDTSNVRNMSGMFYGCNHFTGEGIGRWDTSSCEDMSFMFYSNHDLDTDISNWDVHNLRTTEYMFKYAAGVRVGNLERWNIVPNNVYMDCMFTLSGIPKPCWYNDD